MPKAKPIPEGYHSVTPYLVITGAAKAIEYYKQVFGAEQIVRMDGPNGTVAHAEIKIGDSMVMVGDESPRVTTRSPQSLGGTSVGIFVYVDDVDSVFNKAISTGATAQMPPADMFWGDRYGKFRDPFGHDWAVSTHIEDVAPEEMDRRAREAMAKAPQAS